MPLADLIYQPGKQLFPPKPQSGKSGRISATGTPLLRDRTSPAVQNVRLGRELVVCLGAKVLLGALRRLADLRIPRLPAKPSRLLVPPGCETGARPFARLHSSAPTVPIACVPAPLRAAHQTREWAP